LRHSATSRKVAVEQLVEAQCYKPESRGFEWDLSLTESFRPHFGHGVDSAEISARNI
jgi:hypothetical protein